MIEEEKKIESKSIVLNFKVLVSESNINMLKRLSTKIDMFEVGEEEEFEVGEEIDINYHLEGELTDTAVSIAMLFNGSLSGKPHIRLERG